MTSHTPRFAYPPRTSHRTPFPFLSFNKFLRVLLHSLALAVCFFSISTVDTRTMTDDVMMEDDATLLEVGSSPVAVASKIVAPSELKIVSYNIRWRGGKDLQRIIEILRRDAALGGAHIIGLQEVDRHTKRNGNVNTARLIAEELGMHYAWAAPPHPKEKKTNKKGTKGKPAGELVEDETGVAVLSLFPMTNVERHVLPNPGPGERRRAAVGATLIIGKHRVRVYSVHAETRISTKEKVAQFAHVLDALKQHTDTAHHIVLGDFNTWRGDDKRDTIKLFTDADFTTPFKPGEATFRLPLANWRLDWIWLRGFASVKANGVAREVKISDHYPLWVTVNLNPPSPVQDAARAGV